MSGTHMARRRRRLPRILALATTGTLVLAGTAFAYWAVSGSGLAAATTSGAAPVTLTPGTPSAALYPGGQAAVVLSITNPNTVPVSVGSLALDTAQGVGGFAVDGAHSGCSASALSYQTQTNGGAGWDIPAGATVPVTLAGALSMATSAANACQGATFIVYLRAEP